MYEKKRVTVNTGGTPLDDSALENVAGGWGGTIVTCPYCDPPKEFFIDTNEEKGVYNAHLDMHIALGHKPIQNLFVRIRLN